MKGIKWHKIINKLLITYFYFFFSLKLNLSFLFFISLYYYYLLTLQDSLKIHFIHDLKIIVLITYHNCIKPYKFQVMNNFHSLCYILCFSQILLNILHILDRFQNPEKFSYKLLVKIFFHLNLQCYDILLLFTY